MRDRLYFGNILALIADQNGQGRFQNTTDDKCSVYKQGRRHVFACPVGEYTFDYFLDTGQHGFSRHTPTGTDILPAGWDGLTHGKQMEFVSNLYEYCRRNRMTDASLEEFVESLTKRPI
jgi:hypothetical protein